MTVPPARGKTLLVHVLLVPLIPVAQEACREAGQVSQKWGSSRRHRCKGLERRCKQWGLSWSIRPLELPAQRSQEGEGDNVESPGRMG